MTLFEMSTRGFTARRSIIQQIMEYAGVALINLGIVVAFAAVTFIACLFWLLVW